MRLGIYSVFDRKAAVFARPFTAPNDAMAMRSFLAAKQDPTTEIHKFPEDFSIHRLGDFDDDTGHIQSQPPVALTEA